MRRTMLFAVFAAPVALATAQAQTYPECAKFDEPLAYNQCLASHGPVAGHVGAFKGSAKGAGPANNGAQGGHFLRRGRSGRMSAEFLIEPRRADHRQRKSP